MSTSTSEFNKRMNKIADGEFFRHSISKDHESKFELWDSVWVMFNNQPTKGRICEINIVIKPHPKGGPLGEVKYKLSQIETPTNKNYEEFFVEIEEEKCFPSKESLLENL